MKLNYVIYLKNTVVINEIVDLVKGTTYNQVEDIIKPCKDYTEKVFKYNYDGFLTVGTATIRYSDISAIKFNIIEE